MTRDDVSNYVYRVIRNDRRNQIKRVYGLTTEALIDLLLNQDGKCVVCEVYLNLESRRWHIDHDHKTNKVRGILCHFCNTNLVPVFDSYSHLIPKILKYLGKEGLTL
jgi:hypothetical protein